jgi:O-antigen/teichoic acid export membrane protein
MIKKILTYSVGEVLVKGVSFFAIPLYSHLIFPHEYGTLGFLNSMVSFLPFILTFYYLYAYVRFSIDEDDDILISTYFYMGLFLNLFYLFSALILYFLFIEHYKIELKYFILSILGSSTIYLFQILQMYYRSKGLAKSYIKMSLFYSICGLLLNFIMLFLLEDNILAMLISTTLTALFLSAIAYFILKKFVKWSHFDIFLVKRILKYTLPLVPGAIALLLFSQSDKIILINYVSKEELGVYTLAFTLGLSMSYIGSAFFMGYQPLFYEKLDSNLKSEIEHQFWKNLLFILISLSLAEGVIWFAYQFIDSKYSDGLYISFTIAVSYSLITFAQMMELHLTYIQKTGWVSFVYGAGGLLTIAFLLILIPKYGVVGASISLLLGAFFISVLTYFIAQKKLYLKYNRRVLFLFYVILLLLTIWIIL